MSRSEDLMVAAVLLGAASAVGYALYKKGKDSENSGVAFEGVDVDLL